ncbi:DUF432 domain-containing protein [Methanoregula sp.]|uniref:DUF432 domain-containing protein n=1 Tax=Methanoregula sp. TaxID=2052170 RepID=UPI000CCB36ED|nr:DUF432 domain-containing protein [Methanoregula sp.]PKG33936.1 MAG: hypothetical protein CW742_00375 [Methanoregula sp.]
MFGRYEYPCRFDEGGFTFCIEREGALYKYRRHCGESEVQRTLSLGEAELFVHPIEPVHLPKEVTRFLEIEFPHVTVAPESGTVIYLTFPLEVGVILGYKGEHQLLDVFSKALPKYSLYGTPESGVITRYWRSGVFDRLPSGENGTSGILRLRIDNPGKGWIEVGRVVLDATYMPIYFGPFVSIAAEIVLYSQDLAETRVLNESLAGGMQEAIQVITASRLRLLAAETKGFLMEHGVS